MKLTVIIVSYNVKHYLEQCLNSIQKAMQGIDGQIYVVDNHSKDGTVKYIRKRFPDVTVVASNHNLGFSRANNIAIRQTESEYVLLLNPDTIVGENVIHECLSFMDSHENAGAAGVCMLKSNGSNAMESRRGIPTPMTSLYKMCGLCAKFPKSHRFGKYYMSFLSWDNPEKIEVISGAFFMLRRKALDKAGLLDEDFFMYGEDIDLSYRIMKSGFENWYLPLQILHYKGESTQKSSFRYVHVFYDAMLIFFRKHYGHMHFWITVPIKTAIYCKALIALISIQTERIRKVLGFNSNRGKKYPEYIFLVSAKSMAKCRKLAHDNVLSAQFIECDENSRPEGHLSMLDSIPSGVTTYVVYDIHAYQYSTILRLFSEKSAPNILIGTYNSITNTIITDMEVLK